MKNNYDNFIFKFIQNSLKEYENINESFLNSELIKNEYLIFKN